MMRILRESNGFTLIELMVTLGLLGLVIVGGISIYYFADRSFFSGTITADTQADLQIAMRRITEELRLAHSLVFKTRQDIPESEQMTDDDHYLFIENGSVRLKTKNSTQVLLKGSPEQAGCGLVFERILKDNGEPIDNMIRITLSSLNPKVDYSLQSDLQILNLRMVGVQGASKAEVIQFTKTFTEQEREQAEIVEPGCIFRRHVFASGAPQLAILRNFRDSKLLGNRAGEMLVRLYYAVSPSISSFLDRQALARLTTRTVLRRITGIISYFVAVA